MERRVKERLIGATILVVLVVMFVPEFLSGPVAPVAPGGPGAPEQGAPRSTYVVEAEHIGTEPPAPAGPATASTPPLLEPAPSAAAQPPAVTEPQSKSQTQAPAQTQAQSASPTLPPRPAPPALTPRPAATVRPAPAPAARAAAAPSPKAPGTMPHAAPAAAASPGWAVQAGSFASRANADRLVRELKAEGFSVYVAPIGAEPNIRYRVRVGPLADRAAAAGVIARLQAHKHASTLVSPSE